MFLQGGCSDGDTAKGGAMVEFGGFYIVGLFLRVFICVYGLK